jgi:orotate phosphoribosyltransferase
VPKLTPPQPLSRFKARQLRKRAFEIISATSYVGGAVDLSSGTKSDFYFDLKLTVFDPNGAKILADMILHRLQGMEVDYVGGLETGAVPITSVVTMASLRQGTPLPGFFVRKKAKEHGLRQQIEGISNLGNLKGSNVVVLDDVATSGASSMTAVNALQNSGANVVLVLAIVDREEGAAQLYDRTGVKFDSLFKASDFKT